MWSRLWASWHTNKAEQPKGRISIERILLELSLTLCVWCGTIPFCKGNNYMAVGVSIETYS